MPKGENQHSIPKSSRIVDRGPPVLVHRAGYLGGQSNSKGCSPFPLQNGRAALLEEKKEILAFFSS